MEMSGQLHDTKIKFCVNVFREEIYKSLRIT